MKPWLGLIVLCSAPLQAQPLPALASSARLMPTGNSSILTSFGESLAATNDTLVVGAPSWSVDGVRTGAVFLFDRSTGLERARIHPTGAASGDNFGQSVAVAGNLLFVGASSSDMFGDGSGAVFVYELDSRSLVTVLAGQDTDGGDQFGRSLAVSGDTLVVGARWAADLLGAVYLFDTQTLTQQRVFRGLVSVGSGFGYSVALDNNLLVVGAPFDSSLVNSGGACFVFDRLSGNLLATLRLELVTASDTFGVSVAIDSATVFVGAPGDDDADRDAGAVWRFSGPAWQQADAIFSPLPTEFGRFGSRLTIGAGGLLVAASGEEFPPADSGAVYLYDLDRSEPIFRLVSSGGATSSERLSGGLLLDGSRIYVATDPYAALLSFTPPLVAESPRSTIAGPMPEAVSFRVWPVLPDAPSYQWRHDGMNLYDGGGIEGSGTPTLTIIAGPDDIGRYDCVLTAGDQTEISGSAVLGFRPNPCPSDINMDGQLTFFDVTAYLAEFNRGCP